MQLIKRAFNFSSYFGSESLGELFARFVSAHTHLSVAPLRGSLCCVCLMTELYGKNDEPPNAAPKYFTHRPPYIMYAGFSGG